MSNAITSSTSNVDQKEFGGFLPVNPFRSLYVHFGMLLGVDDFETVDAYHRGKMWLHNAWLHRQGAVWGLKVDLNPDNAQELKVWAGLAVDALGREMLLEADACLHVGRWYEEHKDDPEVAGIVEEDPDGTIRFDAHVVIQHKSCMARQVPALNEPCDSTGATTAYSRIEETVALLLKPGAAPPWREPPGSLPYHRLRLLFALEQAIEEDGVVTASDQAVVDARDGILGLPPEEQPAAYLEAFRRFAALDEMDLTPAASDQDDIQSLFPASVPSPVPLADVLEIALQPTENGWQMTGAGVDNSVRPVHVPTSTIQDLLCGPLFRHTDTSGSESGSESESESGDNGDPQALTGRDVRPPDAGGPRIDPETVSIRGEVITFKVTASTILRASVHARSFSVTSFDVRDGWISEDIQEARYNSRSKEITIQLRRAPEGNLVRLIVKGTGGFPLLGRNRIPLAGGLHGPTGDTNNGNDFVHMFRIRSES